MGGGKAENDCPPPTHTFLPKGYGNLRRERNRGKKKRKEKRGKRKKDEDGRKKKEG
jgi:hypothetical protein